MKTLKSQLCRSWKAGDMSNVRVILKRMSKIDAMDFAVLIALTEGGEAAARLINLMAGYEVPPQNQTLVNDSLPRAWGAESIGAHQVVLYVMCGGGFLGRFAAEQPADFYIDKRVGRLPYSPKEIVKAASTLTTIAKAHGLNPHELPSMPLLHSFGIF